MRIVICAIFLILFIQNMLCAETYYLDDGTVINGVVVEESDTTLTISTEDGSLIVYKDKVFNSLSELKNYRLQKRLWKRHFFDFTAIGGFVFANERDYYSDVYHLFFGGSIGGSLGYQYAVNSIFAIGIGISAFASIIYYNFNAEDAFHTYKNSYITGQHSGVSAMINFMFGSLKEKKIAFLFDIGGGWLFAAKIGIYIKGFVVKLGYHLSFLIYGHTITLDIGYKLNWKLKILNWEDL